MSRASEPIIAFTDGSGIAKCPLRSKLPFMTTTALHNSSRSILSLWNLGKTFHSSLLLVCDSLLNSLYCSQKSANLINIQIIICKACINTGSYVVHTYNTQDSILKSFKIFICCSIFYRGFLVFCINQEMSFSFPTHMLFILHHFIDEDLW